MQCAWQCSDKIVRECHVRKNGTCLKLRCAMSIVVFFHYILITSVTIKPVSFSWGFITCNEFDYHWTTWPVIRFKWVVESLSLWYLSLGNYTYSTYIYTHRKLHNTPKTSKYGHKVHLEWCLLEGRCVMDKSWQRPNVSDLQVG